MLQGKFSEFMICLENLRQLEAHKQNYDLLNKNIGTNKKDIKQLLRKMKNDNGASGHGMINRANI